MLSEGEGEQGEQGVISGMRRAAHSVRSGCVSLSRAPPASRPMARRRFSSCGVQMLNFFWKGSKKLSPAGVES